MICDLLYALFFAEPSCDTTVFSVRTSDMLVATLMVPLAGFRAQEIQGDIIVQHSQYNVQGQHLFFHFLCFQGMRSSFNRIESKIVFRQSVVREAKSSKRLQSAARCTTVGVVSLAVLG